ncbi:unnamed protein product [Boreogadus saida]
MTQSRENAQPRRLRFKKRKSRPVTTDEEEGIETVHRVGPPHVCSPARVDEEEGNRETVPHAGFRHKRLFPARSRNQEEGIETVHRVGPPHVCSPARVDETEEEGIETVHRVGPPHVCSPARVDETEEEGIETVHRRGSATRLFPCPGRRGRGLDSI